ncbi:MAG: NifB/NifX family molybdenum-iron cluster-binding protein [Desulfobacterales bacterium]
MKIAISASRPSLEAPLEPRFGRAPWFLILDPDAQTVEELANPASSAGGTGIETARRIAERGATHVLTGRCGPNAAGVLSAAGVVLVEGCSGTVREALERFLTAGAPEASAVPPSGDTAARGLPPSGGSGLSGPRLFAGGGGRRGCGRMAGGRGGSRRSGGAASGRPSEAVSLEEEAERLRRRLAEIEARLGKRDPRFRR